MKILRIIARLNVGGPARHVVWLTKELQDDEFESVLIAGTVPPGEEDMNWFATENGVAPVFIPEMSRELSIGDIVSLYKVYREMRRGRPDIVHTHTAKAGTIGRSASFLYRWLTWKTLVGKPRPVKVVHTFHGHVFHSYYGGMKTKIFLTIEKTLARFATDRIIAITGQQFREIHEEFGVGRESQFEIVPLGIDLDLYNGRDTYRDVLRDEMAVGPDELLVGFVGRLTEIKNIDLLLHAAKIYSESSAADLPGLKFAIIGDGALRSNLEERSRSLGVSRIVTFLGNRTEPGVFYAGLDIVALTSLNEGTPLSLIEAMAAGKPVISTGVGGVVDLLGETAVERDGFSECERGILVRPGSAEGFANGLIYLAKSEKLRESTASRGQAFARMRYDKSRLVNDIKTLYRNLIKGKADQ
jgi:glycosyltransferase involved in cell wall biosynthesis